MSLFGTPEQDESPSMQSSLARSRQSLFDENSMTASHSNSLFQDDDLSGSGAASPWDLPIPRKQKSRAELIRNILPASDVPDSYIETFDNIVREHGSGGKVTSGGAMRVLAAAKLDADAQAKIMSIISPGGGELSLGRNEFNVLLGLIGLAQEGETINLDGIDERRRTNEQNPSPKLDLPKPKLPGIAPKPAVELFARTGELAAKSPQRPITPPAKDMAPTQSSLDYPDDPWNTPDLHKDHNHEEETSPRESTEAVRIEDPTLNGNGNGDVTYDDDIAPPSRTTSTFTTSSVASAGESAPASTEAPFIAASLPGGGWGSSDFFSDNPIAGEVGSNPVASPFGVPGAISEGRRPSDQRAGPMSSRTIGSGRTGGAVEENVIVSLLPEKEGMFMFQHHNYEVASARRGSKVIRRYSDFVWLLDCLHKRYPFRALPLLPPKRVAVNGNHLSNDGAFIEKRRRGLARYLNALVRHPILSQEQLVIMFMTVPTELSVWRKQATISVQDEFAGRTLPPGLEDSLPPKLEELFERTRSGVRRSAELYINVCSVMDRLVKRSEGVAADHARIALSLASLTDVTADTYATDTNEVPLLNDGLTAMSKHLRASQTLMEDESRAWDEGVLEDLKRQRDALVSVRDLFDRRERLDRDNIPILERRIQNNETKLVNLRAKAQGMVKPGEMERVVEAIMKDKEAIVAQHNRSVFVKECIRDELVFFQSTQYHVTRWNQDWAQERVKYSEMLADNWRQLLDELEGMPLGD
ncbi:Sorting nexin mvp1 [Cytospora mali]|uniref:Sorting nexin MVP1 n=1 Tax=Cytospora mali TaxID=578113 RepID=A0A194V4C2_CYTMA|nr:Sorting nexin mvp1 [Valsa mali var. pyri (nom. inval.)]